MIYFSSSIKSGSRIEIITSNSSRCCSMHYSRIIFFSVYCVHVRARLLITLIHSPSNLWGSQLSEISFHVFSLTVFHLPGQQNTTLLSFKLCIPSIFIKYNLFYKFYTSTFFYELRYESFKFFMLSRWEGWFVFIFYHCICLL